MIENSAYCSEEAKTNQSYFWIRNANYVLKFREILRSKLNIYDGAFFLRI